MTIFIAEDNSNHSTFENNVKGLLEFTEDDNGEVSNQNQPGGFSTEHLVKISYIFGLCWGHKILVSDLDH